MAACHSIADGLAVYFSLLHSGRQALFPLYGGVNRCPDLCHPATSQGCGQGRLGGRCENGEGRGYQRLLGCTLEQDWPRGPHPRVGSKKGGAEGHRT